jgi:serine/threonine-protein kinase HipA
VLRLHQEDLCQALGLMPTAKYQNEGGPSPTQIIALLRDHSSSQQADLDSFVDALIFNWLIGGTDGHAKNYSLLHGGAGAVRLAPLYDLASALAYPELDQEKLKLAMAIGGEYRVRRVGLRQWRAFAREVRVAEARVIERARALASAMIDDAPALAETLNAAGVGHRVVRRLAMALGARARDCLRQLDGPA